MVQGVSMDIEAGQVWVVKAGENDGGEAGEPVMVDRFDRGYIDYFYFRRGNSSEIGDTQKLSRFLDRFEFFADDMGYGKFKNWCVNGIKPN